MNYKSINDIFPGPPLEVISSVSPMKEVKSENSTRIFTGILIIGVVGVCAYFLLRNQDEV